MGTKTTSQNGRATGSDNSWNVDWTIPELAAEIRRQEQSGSEQNIEQLKDKIKARILEWDRVGTARYKAKEYADCMMMDRGIPQTAEEIENHRSEYMDYIDEMMDVWISSKQ